MDDHIDSSLLPENLRHLAALIDRYAESDDSKRSEMLEHASDDDLRELSNAPAAHWDTINAYLDQHVEGEPGPLQDVALALDSFSQAAMEARRVLERRAP